MRTFFLIFIFFGHSIGSIAQTSAFSKPRKTENFEWVNAAWQLQNTVYSVFDNNANFVSNVTILHNNDSLSRTKNNYYVSGNLAVTERIEETFVSQNNWAKNTKWIVGRDSNLALITNHNYIWQNNSWIIDRYSKFNFKNNYKTVLAFYALVSGIEIKDTSFLDIQNRGILTIRTEKNLLGQIDTTSKVEYVYANRVDNCFSDVREYEKTNGIWKMITKKSQITYYQCDTLGLFPDLTKEQSYILENWDAQTHDSVSVNKTYLPNGGYQFIEEHWQNSSYTKKIRTTFTIDNANRTTQIQTDRWTGTEWKSIKIITKVENTNQKEILNRTEILPIASNILRIDQETTTVYNGIDMLQKKWEYYSHTLGGLENRYLKIYSNHQIFNLPTNTQTENTKNHSFKIYPNPAKNIINIELNSPPLEGQGVVDVEITDILGKKVLSVSSPPLDGSGVVDVSTLERGIYFVKITNQKNETFVGKFIRE